MANRVLIVLPSASYRTPDFLTAARSLRAELVVATDAIHVPLGDIPHDTLHIDPRRPEWSADRIAEYSHYYPLAAVVAADDDGVLIAALAAEQLGLAHNPPDAARATRDKLLMRDLFAKSGLAQPRYCTISAGRDAAQACAHVGFPCVLKPTRLNASQGVIRVDKAADVAPTVEYIRDIAEDGGCDRADPILAEAFVPGSEVALEGLLVDGHLEVLALFDKPDAMDGPYFEETILVTPSRLAIEVQEDIATVVGAAADALGLAHGPVHAEVRVHDGQVYLLEVAARSIGGLCGRALSFGLLGTSLEATILGSALGHHSAPRSPSAPAAGAMMLPIPRAGTLLGVKGVEEAKAVLGVVDVEITAPIGSDVRPAPETARYLGFIFANGETPQAVEDALRQAHDRLTIDIR